MKPLAFLRAVGIAAIVAAATAAVNALLNAGERPPPLLFVLLLLWVLSPFAACALAALRATRWSVPARATLYSVMTMVSVGSLPFYATNVLRPPGTPAGFVFVVVPAVSWLLMIAVIIPMMALAIPRRPPDDRSDL